MAEYTPTTDEVRDEYGRDRDGWPDDERRAEFDRWLAQHDAELRAEVERLRAGIEALLPGETVNVHAGGGNLVSQRRVVNPDRLRDLLAGSGEQPGEAVCLTGDATGLDGWCVHVGFRHRSGTPAPVAPDVVRELDAVMHHHADRADAAEAEADRLAALLDVAQGDLAAAEAPAVPDSADVRASVERVTAYLDEMDRVDAANRAGSRYDDTVHGINDLSLRRSDLRAVLAVVRPSGQEGS